VVQHAEWCVIVPLSPADSAKSRLGALGQRRQALVEAFARDVLSAAVAGNQVDHVVVVGDGSVALNGAEAHEWLDTGHADLNAAISAAESHARRRGYSKIAVMMADLPCLRAFDVDDLLRRARTIPRGYVADHQGTGTTALTTTGPALIPRFGRNSAAGHRYDGAVEIEVSVRVRFDVDEPGDLGVALAYGVGAATAAVLALSSQTAEVTDAPNP